MTHRIERDAMGDIEVPADRLYGPETARARLNFPISGEGIGREMIRALGLIKMAAARVNCELGLLDAERAAAIERAAAQVASGALDDHFPVDVFQTGSGTSSHMNANEVIARRASQFAGISVDAHDHVNLGQSSNDVFPSALHVAAVCQVEERLLPALDRLRERFLERAERFRDVIKIGRTHLQDATPVGMAQVLGGYAAQLAHGRGHVLAALPHLRELPIGGTAVGTGINTHPEFGARVVRALRLATGRELIEAGNRFEAQSARDAAVAMSGALRTVAVGLTKIASDLCWLASGPRLGLGELRLPAVQPGSSIMPGKVNPVIAESLLMACVQVIGNDAAIALGGLSGHFELNAMLPLIARNLLEQIRLLAASAANFEGRLVAGLEVERERIAMGLEQSLALATALVPHIGHAAAVAIAQEAARSGRTVREVAIEHGVMDASALAQALDPRWQTGPGR